MLHAKIYALATFVLSVPGVPFGSGEWRSQQQEGWGSQARLVLPEVKLSRTGDWVFCAKDAPKFELTRNDEDFGLLQRSDIFRNERLRAAINQYVDATEKTCVGDERSRSLGPWDGEAYRAILVWDDRNLDGRVDCGETRTLEEASIVTVDVCGSSGILHAQVDEAVVR